MIKKSDICVPFLLLSRIFVAKIALKTDISKEKQSFLLLFACLFVSLQAKRKNNGQATIKNRL
jgi:hypothetical protein